MNSNPLKKENDKEFVDSSVQDQLINSTDSDKTPEFDELGTPLNEI
ncbi:MULTISPECIES: hypothetical protein [Neobacillus]|uniref:Uncharacterized protein n=1 Tax=Neobacillus rhizophilus TaxID=2833579 RepID=A0A942YXM1_9BACI|nr:MULTISPECIES: hypothetical protein [Neobacillus]MBS4216147.1 hypothetical protein [Neobacillus rhizophilus]